MKKTIISICFIFIALGSCKKYPEGPMISILPRTERIEGKWVIENADLNGKDSTEQYKKYIWEFTRFGTVILQIDQSKSLGIWSLATSDKDFVIEYDNGKRETYEIRSLRKRLLWLRNKQTEINLKLKPY